MKKKSLLFALILIVFVIIVGAFACGKKKPDTYTGETTPNTEVMGTDAIETVVGDGTDNAAVPQISLERMDIPDNEAMQFVEIGTPVGFYNDG